MGYNGWKGNYGYTAKWKRKSVEIKGGTEVEGKTLYECLNNYMQIPQRDTEGPLHLSVSSSRIIRKDDVVQLARNGLSGKTFAIQMHHQDVEAGIAGFNVGIIVKFPKGTKVKQVKRGDLLFRPSDYADTPDLQPRRVKSFKATIRVQNHPGDLKVGFSPQMCVRTGRCASRITTIHWVMGKRTAGAKLENPEFVRKHEMAEIAFEPQGFLYLEPFERSESYGRVAGLESKTLVFMGKVVDVEYE